MAKAKNTLRPTGLRAWRERAGLSRMDLVRLLRIRLTPEALYRIETGKSRSTSIENAMEISRALTEVLGEEVTVYDLFASHGFPNSSLRQPEHKEKAA